MNNNIEKFAELLSELSNNLADLNALPDDQQVLFKSTLIQMCINARQINYELQDHLYRLIDQMEKEKWTKLKKRSLEMIRPHRDQVQKLCVEIKCQCLAIHELLDNKNYLSHLALVKEIGKLFKHERYAKSLLRKELQELEKSEDKDISSSRIELLRVIYELEGYSIKFNETEERLRF